jgi:hypothetical protein
MSNIKRRIEKLEQKTGSIKMDPAVRKAKLLELERARENDDLVKAFILQGELTYGRQVTLAEVLDKLHKQEKSRGKE